MNNVLAYSTLNTLFVVIVSPLFMGIIKKVKAWSQGRKGQPLLQQYYNLVKLFQKECVISSTSSWITKATPYINISVLLAASLFVPIAFAPETQLFGNIILFFYLLALAKFFMALSGLDAGSTFGGMGSSREMSISSIVEPVTFLIFLALAFVFKTTDIFSMFVSSTAGIFAANPLLILLIIPLFIVLIAETARVPVDNPETHLELTMIHEAMILEQSGKNLAMMEISHAIKQTLLMALLINIFIPFGFSSEGSAFLITIGFIAFAAKGIILAAIIGIFESSLAKMRIFRLPVFFTVAFFLAFLTILLEVFV